MAVNLENLGIDQLSIGDRLELIEQIWDSLPEQIAPQNSRMASSGVGEAACNGREQTWCRQAF